VYTDFTLLFSAFNGEKVSTENADLSRTCHCCSDFCFFGKTATTPADNCDAGAAAAIRLADAVRVAYR